MVNGQAAFVNDLQTGTLLYLMETRQPCDCGCTRVLLGFAAPHPKLS